MSSTPAALSYRDITTSIYYARKRLEKTDDPAEEIRLKQHIELMKRTQSQIKRRNLYQEMLNHKGGK